MTTRRRTLTVAVTHPGTNNNNKPNPAFKYEWYVYTQPIKFNIMNFNDPKAPERNNLITYTGRTYTHELPVKLSKHSVHPD